MSERNMLAAIAEEDGEGQGSRNNSRYMSAN